MSIIMINNNTGLVIQNMLNTFNNKYIYIYNNNNLSNKGYNNNLLFIIDTFKYKILVINKADFTTELDLFNKVKEFNIEYLGHRNIHHSLCKIKSEYKIDNNNYKFKITFNNHNNMCYLHIKNTTNINKKKRKYICYTMYYIFKNELVIPQPYKNIKKQNTIQNKKKYHVPVLV